MQQQQQQQQPQQLPKFSPSTPPPQPSTGAVPKRLNQKKVAKKCLPPSIPPPPPMKVDSPRQLAAAAATIEAKLLIELPESEPQRCYKKLNRPQASHLRLRIPKRGETAQRRLPTPPPPPTPPSPPTMLNRDLTRFGTTSATDEFYVAPVIRFKY